MDEKKLENLDIENSEIILPFKKINPRQIFSQLILQNEKKLKKHWIYKHIHPIFLYIINFLMYIIIRELVE